MQMFSRALENSLENAHSGSKMEDNNIIVRVTEPTEWVNALVVVEKPKSQKLRVCLNPRDLNKAIQRPHYPLPSQSLS
ncbi:hypothetical protein QQF64_020132 [Cirrhinus molitorella]|uniref:Uncharacterized protein n=1 Tax=Cirrhinus molitorella TaxID=172907 RepID=A0ABR3L8F7_9TELE